MKLSRLAAILGIIYLIHRWDEKKKAYKFHWEDIMPKAQDAKSAQGHEWNFADPAKCVRCGVRRGGAMTSQSCPKTQDAKVLHEYYEIKKKSGSVVKVDADVIRRAAGGSLSPNFRGRLEQIKKVVPDAVDWNWEEEYVDGGDSISASDAALLHKAIDAGLDAPPRSEEEIWKEIGRLGKLKIEGKTPKEQREQSNAINKRIESLKAQLHRRFDSISASDAALLHKAIDAVEPSYIIQHSKEYAMKQGGASAVQAAQYAKWYLANYPDGDGSHREAFWYWLRNRGKDSAFDSKRERILTRDQIRKRVKRLKKHSVDTANPDQRAVIGRRLVSLERQLSRLTGKDANPFLSKHLTATESGWKCKHCGENIGYNGSGEANEEKLKQHLSSKHPRIGKDADPPPGIKMKCTSCGSTNIGYNPKTKQAQCRECEVGGHVENFVANKGVLRKLGIKDSISAADAAILHRAIDAAFDAELTPKLQNQISSWIRADGMNLDTETLVAKIMKKFGLGKQDAIKASNVY